MKNRRLYIFLAIFGILIVIGIIILIVPSKSDRTSSSNNGEDTTSSSGSAPVINESNPLNASSSSPTNEPVVIDPEEKYPLAVQANLPYETDTMAIIFKVDKATSSGIIFEVIDKTQQTHASDSIKNSGLAYLKARGIDVNSVKIEYLGLNDAR